MVGAKFGRRRRRRRRLQFLIHWSKLSSSDPIDPPLFSVCQLRASSNLSTTSFCSFIKPCIFSASLTCTVPDEFPLDRPAYINPTVRCFRSQRNCIAMLNSSMDLPSLSTAKSWKIASTPYYTSTSMKTHQARDLRKLPIVP